MKNLPKDILKVLCRKEQLEKQMKEMQSELDAINMTLRVFDIAA